MPTSFILAAFSAAVPQSSPVYVNYVQRYCKIGEIVCFTQDVIQIHLFSFYVCFLGVQRVETNRWCCWCINKVQFHICYLVCGWNSLGFFKKKKKKEVEGKKKKGTKQQNP